MRHRHWSRMVGVVLMRRSLRCMGRFLHTQASDDHRPESVPSRVGSIYKWSNSARSRRNDIARGLGLGVVGQELSNTPISRCGSSMVA